MKRVMASDENLRQIDGSGITYSRNERDKSFQMTDRDAKAAVEWGCFIAPIVGTGSRTDGFRCTSCGFGSWFRLCSRCGSECERES